MAEMPDDINTVLAEATALASEAVRQIVGEDPSAAEQDWAAIPAAAPPQPPTATPTPTAAQTNDPAATRVRNLRRILELEVPVIVQLAERTLPLSEIINLTSGAIIEFDRSAESPLELMINNKCIGNGQAVKVGENFGLRVTGIGTLRERIKALSQ